MHAGKEIRLAERFRARSDSSHMLALLPGVLYCNYFAGLGIAERTRLRPPVHFLQPLSHLVSACFASVATSHSGRWILRRDKRQHLKFTPTLQDHSISTHAGSCIPRCKLRLEAAGRIMPQTRVSEMWKTESPPLT